MERKVAWEKYNDEQIRDVFEFADDYKKFISDCKTERECVKEIIRQAKEKGYRDLKDIIAENVQ